MKIFISGLVTGRLGKKTYSRVEAHDLNYWQQSLFCKLKLIMTAKFLCMNFRLAFFTLSLVEILPRGR